MHVPKLRADGVRYYGCWAGNPKGRREDPFRCIAEVADAVSWVDNQCARKRGHGPHGAFCKQHANKATDADVTC